MKALLRILSVLIAGMFVLLVSACGGSDHAPKQAAAKQVVVLKAYAMKVHDQVEALGTAQANESITITAKVSGRLDAIKFTDGQQVKKGDVIAVLDQDEEQAQLKAAEVQLAEHVREVKRLQTLLARKAAATRDLDERKTLAAVTASNVNEIKARIAELTLKAPFDGKIGIRRVSPGALIQPGQVITTLDQIDPIKLDFSIPSTMLEGLHAGDRIEARADALGGQPFIGTVSATDSRIDPLTRSILLRAIIDNSEGKLIPGMLMRVTILAHERQALMVPEEAVTQKQDKHYLTLVGADGSAVIRPVRVGTRQHGLVEMLDGLSVGERVVVRGMGFVKPGAKLQVTETWDRIQDSQFSATAGQGI